MHLGDATSLVRTPFVANQVLIGNKIHASEPPLCFQIITGAGTATLVGADTVLPHLTSPPPNGITSVGRSLPPIEKLVQRHLADFAEVPGCAVVITKGNKAHWARAYGKCNLRTDASFTLETTHNLGSVTKTYMTTLMLTLVDQKLIDLDADVNTYLPYQLRSPHFPKQPITLRMLLSHTSGLAEVGPEPGPYAEAIEPAICQNVTVSGRDGVSHLPLTTVTMYIRRPQGFGSRR